MAFRMRTFFAVACFVFFFSLNACQVIRTNNLRKKISLKSDQSVEPQSCKSNAGCKNLCTCTIKLVIPDKFCNNVPSFRESIMKCPSCNSDEDCPVDVCMKEYGINKCFKCLEQADKAHMNECNTKGLDVPPKLGETNATSCESSQDCPDMCTCSYEIVTPIKFCIKQESLGEIGKCSSCDSAEDCPGGFCLKEFGINACNKCYEHTYNEAANECNSGWLQVPTSVLFVPNAVLAYAFAFYNLIKELQYGMKNGLDDPDKNWRYPELFLTVALGIYGCVSAFWEFFSGGRRNYISFANEIHFILVAVNTIIELYYLKFSKGRPSSLIIPTMLLSVFGLNIAMFFIVGKESVIGAIYLQNIWITFGSTPIAAFILFILPVNIKYRRIFVVIILYALFLFLFFTMSYFFMGLDARILVDTVMAFILFEELYTIRMIRHDRKENFDGEDLLESPENETLDAANSPTDSITVTQ